MDTELLKKVGTAFKYGARVIQDGHDPVDVVDLTFAESEGVPPTILAWAYPNKDLYFEIKSVEERPDGWLLGANGSRYLFKPLDKATGTRLAVNMKDA